MRELLTGRDRFFGIHFRRKMKEGRVMGDYTRNMENVSIFEVIFSYIQAMKFVFFS